MRLLFMIALIAAVVIPALPLGLAAVKGRIDRLVDERRTEKWERIAASLAVPADLKPYSGVWCAAADDRCLSSPRPFREVAVDVQAALERELGHDVDLTCDASPGRAGAQPRPERGTCQIWVMARPSHGILVSVQTDWAKVGDRAVGERVVSHGTVVKFWSLHDHAAAHG